MKMKRTKYFIIGLSFGCIGLSQLGDFDLVDLNPSSDTYGQIIGPDDYLGDICIVFFGHEY